jgi:ribosomal protein S18 acetylase RimI-like enzyme
VVTGLIEVHRAPATAADTIAAVIAAAFQPLDVARWLIADDTERARVFRGYFRIFVDHALTYGLIEATPALSAVALWLPSTAPPPPEYHERLAYTCGPHLVRFRQLDATFAAAHSVAPPHEHLAMLAVHPQRQNTGLGTALLAHRHRQLDRDATPACLEASSAGSRALYERHGYRDVSDRPVHLPQGGPAVWPMRRPPQPAELSEA